MRWNYDLPRPAEPNTAAPARPFQTKPKIYFSPSQPTLANGLELRFAKANHALPSQFEPFLSEQYRALPTPSQRHASPKIC
jgi:hypothetical protein